LVAQVHDGKAYTLLAHRLSDGATVVNKITSTLHEDFKLPLNQLDVVLWECFMPAPTTVFGRIIGKTALGIDEVSLDAPSPDWAFHWSC
jgi:hypothetical protein